MKAADGVGVSGPIRGKSVLIGESAHSGANGWRWKFVWPIQGTVKRHGTSPCEWEGEEWETKAGGKLELSDHVKEIPDNSEDFDLCFSCCEENRLCRQGGGGVVGVRQIDSLDYNENTGVG